MRFHSPSLSAGLVGFLLAAAVPASADLIEFTFGGTIDTVGALSAPFASVGVGNRYTLSYVFNSNAIDGDLSGSVGTYDGAIQSFSLSIGSASFTDPIDFSSISVDDESVAGTESYDAIIITTSFDIGVTSGLSPGTLASDELPRDFSLANFTGFTFFIDDANETFAEGNLTSFSSQVVSVVPLPGSALLGVAGFGAVGWLRRRSLA